MGGGSRWVGMVLAVLVVGGGWAGSLAHAQSWVPERRKDQFPTDQSYLAVAAPYSLPGLGAGIGLVAYETNYFGFANQGYLVYLTGDDEGFIAADQQIQVIRHRLLLDLQYGDLSKTRFQEFTFRGMNTSARDFNVLESAYAWFQPQLTLTDEERRWELFYNPYQQQTSLARIRDNAGNLTATFSPPLRTYQVINTYGASLDLTDDLHDPRRGTHLGLTVEDFPRTDAAQPDYYVTNVSASVYVPVWGISAWALNYFRSDAQVRSPGLTDRAAIAAQQGLFCAPGDAPCQAALTARVNNILAANTNGSAEALGGQYRLRAYPQSRFQGAHTEYLSTELRINVTEEFTPFDYVFFKGIRTGIQIAPFYEIGTVAESASALWALNRADYGVGARLITASGAVYRLDVAVGDEGTGTTITINYPW